MENLTVLSADVKDARGIAKVHVETWQNAYRGQLPDSYLNSLSVAKREKRWIENLNNHNSKFKVFVAKTGDKVIGFASVGPCRDDDMNQKTGELGAIYVGSEYMGQGVGTSLMETGLNYLREQGFSKATLWVLATNEKTRNWYESKGWKVEGKTKTEPREDFELNEIRYIIKL